MRTTTNADIAAVFDEIADLLDIQGANSFRIRAYRNAARMLTGLGQQVKPMLDRGENLDELPGIGADLAAKIAEVVATGSCALLDRLRKEVPSALKELLGVAGLGPKRLRILHDELGIESIDQLRRAAEFHRIRELRSFGARTEALILQSVRLRQQAEHRVKWVVAEQVAHGLVADLKSVRGVKRVEAAGSLRRLRDTVGDIDLVMSVGRGSSAMEHFVSSPDVDRVISQGRARSSVMLKNGQQVDLRVVAPPSFGAAWIYFTGSKAHNIALRRIAQGAGLKLNEYGLFKGEERIAGQTEASVYRALGLTWVDPELREDRGEIAAASRLALPSLVRLDELRGDLHVHTRDSDGRGSLENMAEAARRAGLHYLAITDHSQHLAVAHGLDAGRLARQIDHIDELNERLEGIVLLKGVEVDILEDGSLDLPDAVLSRLDLVVGAVHQHFDLPRAKQTDRLLRAMDGPRFSILAHPGGRLIGERPPCDVDMQRVIRKARERSCFLELNADPSRLDLDDVACRMAKDEGVLVSIASDAHDTTGFGNLRFGVGQARRGWLEAHDVLNTRSLAALRPMLRATMGQPSITPARKTAGAPPLATASHE